MVPTDDFMEPAQTEYFRRILFAAEPPISKLKDPDDDNRLMRVKYAFKPSLPVESGGRLIGGNFRFSAMVGSPYLPDLNGAILF